MKIIETNLSFRPMDIRNTTEQIVLHHSGVTVRQSVETIHNYHKNTNGWSGIGYHFYVRTTGEIYRGRPENTVGAHAVGANYNSIGICFEGNFSKEKMGEKQIKAGQELVAYLKEKYGISKVVRHRDVDNSECPGNDFPFNEIKNGTSTSKPSTSTSNKYICNSKVLEWQKTVNKVYGENLVLDSCFGPDCESKALKHYLYYRSNIINNDYVLLFQKLMNEKGYKLEKDGMFGPDCQAKTKSLQKKNGLDQDGCVGPDTIKLLLKQ